MAATVYIPRTSARREATYAQLIRRVNHRGSIPFEGQFFRTGSRTNESNLHPSPEWPKIPLLIEYAGSDSAGSGHRRSRDVHVLWKFDELGWVELGRVTSQGPEWWQHLKPIVIRELRGPRVNFVELARESSNRVIDLLDRELDGLEGEGRERAMSFLYDQFAARLTSHAA